AEFPTTMEAARGLHQAGIDILMGAPNVVRGGSHSGNIAAVDLAREGLLDILSSDYVPSSLLMGALQLPKHVPAIDLAAAVRTVTKTPAEAVGLSDRGEIAVGKRADVIRVHVARDIPVVRSVWREGRRVACAKRAPYPPPDRRRWDRAGSCWWSARAAPARTPCLALRAAPVLTIAASSFRAAW